MIEITTVVIGIGSGAPRHLTAEGAAAMNDVDLFLVADKGPTKHDLAAIRSELCAAVIAHDHYRVVEVEDPPRDRRSADYDTAVRQWHAARAERYRETIREQLPNGGTVGFLVWGDPGLYDSTIRVAASLAAPGIEVDLHVVPGLSSPQLLAAAHRIVLNEVGRPILITTGRRLPEDLSASSADLVVMLDGDLACAELASTYPDLTIYWAAQLGLPDQTLRSGPLSKVITAIQRERARIRQQRGWVLDIYLLRRAN